MHSNLNQTGLSQIIIIIPINSNQSRQSYAPHGPGSDSFFPVKRDFFPSHFHQELFQIRSSDCLGLLCVIVGA